MNTSRTNVEGSVIPARRPEFSTPTPQHYTRVTDLTQEQLRWVLDEAVSLRLPILNGQPIAGEGTGRKHILQDTAVAWWSTKESLRTGASIEQAATKLGGSVYSVGKSSLVDELGKEREPTNHMIRCLEQQGFPIVFARVHTNEQIMKMVKAAQRLHVINALCNEHHPLQAIADIEGYMLHRTDRPKQPQVTFMGDGNNVANSLAGATALLGWNFVHSGPPDRRIKADNWTDLERVAEENGGSVKYVEDPEAAMEGTDFAYGDVFASMGEKFDKAALEAKMARWRMTRKLIERGNKGIAYGHCLPVDPNWSEVDPDVFDDPEVCIAFTIAGCRVDANIAMMELLMQY